MKTAQRRTGLMAPEHAVHHGEKNMEQKSNSHHGEQKKGKDQGEIQSPGTLPSNLLLPVRTTPCFTTS